MDMYISHAQSNTKRIFLCFAEPLFSKYPMPNLNIVVQLDTCIRRDQTLVKGSGMDTKFFLLFRSLHCKQISARPACTVRLTSPYQSVTLSETATIWDSVQVSSPPSSPGAGAGDHCGPLSRKESKLRYR